MTGRPAPVWCLVPAKCFARAKSRLAPVLSDVLRAALAEASLSHVLEVLRQLSGDAQVLLLTDDDQVATCAALMGVASLRDVKGASLAAVVDAGLREVSCRGGRSVLVCMADLPLLEADDLRSVVAALEATQVVVVPDASGRGTNVLALRDSGAMATSFGREDSCARHVATARGLGLSVQVLILNSVCLDIDEPSDLSRVT